jgi:hypothetical protein
VQLGMKLNDKRMIFNVWEIIVYITPRLLTTASRLQNHKVAKLLCDFVYEGMKNENNWCYRTYRQW